VYCLSISCIVYSAHPTPRHRHSLLYFYWYLNLMYIRNRYLYFVFGISSINSYAARCRVHYQHLHAVAPLYLYYRWAKYLITLWTLHTNEQQGHRPDSRLNLCWLFSLSWWCEGVQSLLFFIVWVASVVCSCRVKFAKYFYEILICQEFSFEILAVVGLI